MAQRSVLITGGGVAGPVLAYWLKRAGMAVTIVERCSELRMTGQGIDIRGAGLEVVRRMGLEKDIRSNTTGEEGLKFVDSTGRTRAEFPVDSKSGKSFTSDVEILRGNLVSVFYEASRKDTEYVFGDYVKHIEDLGDKVHVKFDKGPERNFDLVVAADGQNSRTRRLIFGDEGEFKSLGQFTSYFTIPYRDEDGTWAKWYNAPGGRCILLRPDGTGTTRAYLSIMSSKPENYLDLDVAGQKSMLRDLFSDAGGEVERVLLGMDEAEDFYMQEVGQVRMPAWSKGRIALLGDAGYCPSPISGMGTSLAITGAYILAGELSRHGDDTRAAFEAYEALMRPYVEKAQSLPPGAPALANPQSAWGIAILNGILSFASKSGLATFFGKFSSPPAEAIKLPMYEI